MSSNPLARRLSILLLGVALTATALAPSCAPPAEQVDLPGLMAPVKVYTDAQGTPHIVAGSRIDLFRVWGYVLGRDRFFQMDVLRRTAAGRSAELLGFVGLGTDAVVRPMGLYRAGARSEALLDPTQRARGEAFAEGVNAWLSANPLPPKYTQLEITAVPPWTLLDSFAVGKLVAAQEARGWEVEETRQLLDYQAALGLVPGRALFFEDLGREQPILPVPADPESAGLAAGASAHRGTPALTSDLIARAATRLGTSGLDLAARWPRGSNAWAVAGRHTETDAPIVAGDNHNEGGVPNLYYEIHVAVRGGSGPELNVAGIGIPFGPLVIQGHNGSLAWTSTASGADDTDFFEDRLVRSSPDCTVRLCIVSEGVYHPVVERTETYFVNNDSDGIPDNTSDWTFLVAAQLQGHLATTPLEVPFRSFGPVIEIDDPSVLAPGPVAETRVLTQQWTGAHGDPLVGLDDATDVFDFRERVARLQYKANFIVADAAGNVAYLLGGELPLRADLEQGFVYGNELRLVRDGSGPNNWISDPEYSSGQSIPYRVIPRDEMAEAINPYPGYVISANHDAVGETYDNDPFNQFRPSAPGAILHFGSGDNETGFRAGRIRSLLEEVIASEDAISMQDVADMQGNSQGTDAELFRPYLLAALTNAQRAGAPPELSVLAQDLEVQEAFARIAAWGLTAPTGIPEGWDYGRPPAPDPVVPADEAEASVAATLFEVWRDRFNKATVLAALGPLGLQHVNGNQSMTKLLMLLAEDPFTGVGASGLDFFQGPAHLTPEDRRDLALLLAMRTALDDLAGPRFANEYGGSTIQDDYRWGRAHRLTLPDRFGLSNAIPTAAGFTDLAPSLPGLPVGGGRFTVNPGHSNFADLDFIRFIASNRIVMSFDADGSPIVWNQMAGPSPADTTNPVYHEGVERWLTGTPHRLEMRIPVVAQEAVRTEVFQAPAP